MSVAIVLAGGDPPSPAVTGEFPEPDLVIAADGGLSFAESLGLRVDLLVGDLDSVDEATIGLHPHLDIERHPTDKDLTDLELALRAASERGIERVIVVGGHGGRLDHELTNAGLIASEEYAHLDIEWLAGHTRVRVVHHSVQIHGTPGDLVSLVPAGGAAAGVRTQGLRWPLENEDLPFGSTRGVSNRLARPVATISVASGTLMVIKPDAIAD